MRDLYVIRHGETVANVERRFDATPPGAPLTPRGEEQAAGVADWLFAKGATPREIHVSPFLRTRRTAQPFAARSGSPLVLREELREVSVGLWDGRRSSMLQSDPQYLGWRDDPTVAPPGGETLAYVLQRTLALILALDSAAAADEPLVLCTHQQNLRALLWHLHAMREADGSLAALPNATILHLGAHNRDLELIGIDRSVEESTRGQRRVAT